MSQNQSHFNTDSEDVQQYFNFRNYCFDIPHDQSLFDLVGFIGYTLNI